MGMPDTVAFAYISGGTVATAFHQSVVSMLMYDVQTSRRIRGHITGEVGAGRIDWGRNQLVRDFLPRPEPWLLMVDTDMGFEASLADRLVEVADAERRPVVGGLCLAQFPVKQGHANSWQYAVRPAVYNEQDDGSFEPWEDVPPKLVEVDATGAACLLIHRTVLQKLDDGSPMPWFANVTEGGNTFGEDIEFCRRVRAAGFPVHVDGRVRLSHRKPRFLL